MARFPGAIWKPITASKGRKPLTVWNRVNLHVAVSEQASLHDYFDVAGRVDSHFYVRRDGTVEQYVDTAMRAFADLEGNDATISIETQGMADGTWTAQQLEALAQVAAWAMRTHGIPVKLATSSAPGDPSRGLSWHRLGVPYRGVYSVGGVVVKRLDAVAPGYLQSRDHLWWSVSAAKACPGPDRIPQIPAILARAVRILAATTVSNPVTAGGTVTVPTLPGAPAPLAPASSLPSEGDPMLILRNAANGAAILIHPSGTSIRLSEAGDIEALKAGSANAPGVTAATVSAGTFDAAVAKWPVV